MAGTKVRGITIELSADASGVSNALKNVNSSINSTSKELRDIEKLLKLDPSNVELLAQKQKALQEQISNTNEKLKVLNQAEEDLKKQMEDGGTDEQKKQLAALEREIIATEQQTKSYTEQLDKTNTTSQELAKSEEDLQNSTSKMNEGFTVMKGVLANLVADGLRKAADAFKSLAVDAPAFADDMLTLSSVTSLSTDTLQEYAYMADLVDVDVNTITGSLKKLTNNMRTAREGTGAAAETFETLGIAITDNNGELRNAEDVFNDAIDVLAGIKNETERDALAMTMFGKSAQELNPLIEAGSEKIEEFRKEAHEMGYVLEGEALDSLGAVQDSFDRWNKQVEGIKNTIAVGFAPQLEKAMKRISQAMKEIDWAKVGKDVGKAFDGILNAFEWILKNGNVVKSILAGVISAMAVNKIGGVVTALGNMVTQLKNAATGQKALNAAADANPYVMLATVIAGLAVAFGTLAKSVQEAGYMNTEAGRSARELSSATEDLISKNNDCVESYNGLQEAKEAALVSGLAEIEHVQSLADELESLVDANGNVLEGEEARADFILGELNRALGTEYQQVDGLIQGYDTLTSSIDGLLKKKRAEIILSAQEESYRQAIVNRTAAEKQLQDTTSQRISIMEEIAANEAEITRLGEEMAQTGIYDGSAVYQMQNLAAANAELGSSLEELDASFAEQKNVVDGYYHDITQYEENFKLAHEGNYEAIDATSWEALRSMGEATSEYSDTIVTETEKQTGKWKEELGKQLSEVTGRKIEFKDAGNGLVQAYIDGQEAGEPQAKAKMRAFGNHMVQEINNKKPDMVSAGKNLDDGVSEGIAGNQHGALWNVQSFASNILSSFKNVLGIASPSKEMIKAMGFVADGISVGLARNEASVLQDVDRFGHDISTRMTSALMGAQAAKYGLNASMNMANPYAPQTQQSLPPVNLVLDSGELVGAIAPKMNNEFGSMQKLSLRGV